jgi:ATP-dependent DNA ligase
VSPRTSRTLPLVEPILRTSRLEPFDDPAWLFEPNYDGYRGLLYVTRLRGGRRRSQTWQGPRSRLGDRST